MDFGKEPFDTSPQRTHRRKNCPFRMRVCVCSVGKNQSATCEEKARAEKEPRKIFYPYTHARPLLFDCYIYIFFGTSHTSGVRARMRFTNECSFCWVVYLRGTPCVFNVKMRVMCENSPMFWVYFRRNRSVSGILKYFIKAFYVVMLG